MHTRNRIETESRGQNYSYEHGRLSRPTEHGGRNPSLHKSSHHRHMRSNSTDRRNCHHSDSAQESSRHGSKTEHAAEKAIETAASSAFRMRHDPGRWVGEKGLKVVTAAVAAAAIDAMLDANAKDHPLQHIVASMIQGVVKDVITSGALC
ncbi:hypothetical protein BKA67DRAFT_585802 [Truncatella angustata]|uniref:Uncharacterized protein n=1 Tax=Truncatella angustata TaxID=152316 RepID=A0A9P8RGW3_9PEZI|nr:uncharacterized protein BKA67DRAFT_585802 [Truncatella angustata]KAH6645612.1 hypothetical protein BKA67DRAFT_585802 [Truncatella angustata]